MFGGGAPKGAVRPACLLLPLCVLLTSCADKAAQSSNSIPPLSAAAVRAAAAAPEVLEGRAALPDTKRDADAVATFTKGAEQGNPVAQTYLGYLYYMGHGVRQNDQLAAQWYKRAAEQGFVDAELRLGLMYQSDRNLYDPARTLPRDDTQAVSWLQRAADHGNLLALNKIGEVHLIAGLGSGNFDQARYYFRQTAEKGDPTGLADMCFTYTVLRDNSDEGHDWCALAKQHPYTGPGGNLGDSILESDQIPMP